MPYQADFGEELQSWLPDTETTGRRVIGTQTCDPVPPAAEAEPVPSPVNEDEAGFSGSDSEGFADTELEDDNISAPATPPRHGLRPRRVPDRYPPINQIAYTMKLVYIDHPRDQQNVVFIHRWSLYAGSIAWKVYT